MSGRFSLDGRAALVTGGGRGIGRACALALGEAGAQVTALSRTGAELGQLVEHADSLGLRMSALPCDVTDSGSVRGAIADLRRLDVVVACAGMNRPDRLVDVEDEDLDAVLALNLRATFVTLQAAARRMIAAGGGSVVLLSSQMGHVGAARRTVYCATKHAVEGLAKAAAVELAPHGVRVNTVAPTFVETPMTAPLLADPDVAAELRGKIPLGRIGTVDEIVGAVVFLASDAARLVTGASLLVDGGWTAQ